AKAFRVKAALVLAALYTLCILAPSAAFAFSANPSVAHCLTEGHVGVHDHGKAHVHTDGTAHHHDHDGAAPPSGDDEKSRMASCCSLFSVVAIAGAPGCSLGLYSPASMVLPALADALSGRGPERINRPPIACPSLLKPARAASCARARHQPSVMGGLMLTQMAWPADAVG